MLAAHTKYPVGLVIPMWTSFYRDLVEHYHSMEHLLHRRPKDITNGLETCHNVGLNFMGCRERR